MWINSLADDSHEISNIVSENKNGNVVGYNFDGASRVNL